MAKAQQIILASQKVVNSDEALQSGLIQDVFDDDEYDEKLSVLAHKLTLNDRTFIEYLKKNQHRNITDELEPFTQFWESEEHISRVTDFLNRKQ